MFEFEFLEELLWVFVLYELWFVESVLNGDVMDLLDVVVGFVLLVIRIKEDDL